MAGGALAAVVSRPSSVLLFESELVLLSLLLVLLLSTGLPGISAGCEKKRSCKIEDPKHHMLHICMGARVSMMF